MCGRLVFKDNTESLLPDLFTCDFASMRSNYNPAPTSPVTVIRERDVERSRPSVHWGLVPVWAKDLQEAATAADQRPDRDSRNLSDVAEGVSDDAGGIPRGWLLRVVRCVNARYG